MSDGILNWLDPDTLAEHFGKVDLEYTWLREQTPSEAETLRAALEFERQQVKDLSATAEYYRALVQEARDERDAAIADARELAAYAFISFPSDAYIVPAATLEKVLGLCEKYGAK